jgi:hypothetical protein
VAFVSTDLVFCSNLKFQRPLIQSTPRDNKAQTDDFHHVKMTLPLTYTPSPLDRERESGKGVRNSEPLLLIIKLKLMACLSFHTFMDSQ